MNIGDEEDRKLALKIVNKMLRKTVVGSHKKQVDTVKGWVATHNEKRAEEIIRELMKDPDAPIEAYGGSRGGVQIRNE